MKTVFSMDLMLRPKKARSSATDPDEVSQILQRLDEDLINEYVEGTPLADCERVQKEREAEFKKKMAEGARMAPPEPEPQPPRPFSGRLPKKPRQVIAALAEEQEQARAPKMSDLELAAHNSLESTKELPRRPPPQLLICPRLEQLEVQEAEEKIKASAVQFLVMVVFRVHR